MSTLSGHEIIRQRELGNIRIDPWNPDHVGPNSYDLTLSPQMRVYTRFPLDMRKLNPTTEFVIPEEGFLLLPHTLYLGSTNEYTETHGFVPCLETRSSLARLGLPCHLSAGFGDDGFCGAWTLEITVVHPLIVYPNVRICQISYSTIEGERNPYKGRYQGQRGPVASRFHEGVKL